MIPYIRQLPCPPSVAKSSISSDPLFLFLSPGLRLSPAIRNHHTINIYQQNYSLSIPSVFPRSTNLHNFISQSSWAHTVTYKKLGNNLALILASPAQPLQMRLRPIILPPMHMAFRVQRLIMVRNRPAHHLIHPFESCTRVVEPTGVERSGLGFTT